MNAEFSNVQCNRNHDKTDAYIRAVDFRLSQRVDNLEAKLWAIILTQVGLLGGILTLLVKVFSVT